MTVKALAASFMSVDAPIPALGGGGAHPFPVANDGTDVGGYLHGRKFNSTLRSLLSGPLGRGLSIRLRNVLSWRGRGLERESHHQGQRRGFRDRGFPNPMPTRLTGVILGLRQMTLLGEKTGAAIGVHDSLAR